MKNKSRHLLTVLGTLCFMFFSCDDKGISESWAMNKFKEETGLNKGLLLILLKGMQGRQSFMQL